jgi:hypothetical protein
MSKEPQRAESWRNRIVGEDTCDPSQLLANPYNWRIHPHEQELALRGILDEVGWVQRVIVNKRTGHVVDGHLRVATAISKGEKAVPVLYVDLTEDEEKKVLLTIDPIAGMAATDEEQLKTLLADVEIESAAIRKALGVDEKLAAPEDVDDPLLVKHDLSKSPPTMTWVLVGIPTVRFAAIAKHVEAIAKIKDAVVESTVNDAKHKD